MKILIDTQVFIWIINGDSRLGENSRILVDSLDQEIYASFISFFEMTIKASLHKLDFDPSIINDLEKMNIELLHGSAKTLEKYSIVDSKNKDPFDNFLIATAREKDLSFLTSDDKILELVIPDLNLIDARK